MTAPVLARLRQATARSSLVRRTGRVRQLVGLGVVSHGPDVAIGELCEIVPRDGAAPSIEAEVVALRDDAVTLMPYGPLAGIAAGCEVVATGGRPAIGVGDALLGRVIDATGRPLDGRRRAGGLVERPVRGRPVNPLERPRIRSVMETGVRSIDTLLTLGLGQRVGIFAGSGVGKSTLLGMIARHAKAEVNVIALIGERGREVAEFIDKHLGPQGLARSVVVVAASDEPALLRLRAAYAAIAIAEAFRDAGRHVLLTMDSVTRFAMARREVGLSAGEPPTARGYTPSVFSEIPELCERCGTSASGGSITALMTVLVEGDDMNEPIADALRATLDGHIVLSRAIAQRGHFPAIDPLRSASRVMPDIVAEADRSLAIRAVRTLSVLERNRPLVELGAYQRGSNPELDLALACEPAIQSFLDQSAEGVARELATKALVAALDAPSMAAARGVR
jgi:flagellum-specific ATP synthase